MLYLTLPTIYTTTPFLTTPIILHHNLSPSCSTLLYPTPPSTLLPKIHVHKRQGTKLNINQIFLNIYICMLNYKTVCKANYVEVKICICLQSTVQRLQSAVFSLQSSVYSLQSTRPSKCQKIYTTMIFGGNFLRQKVLDFFYIEIATN